MPDYYDAVLLDSAFFEKPFSNRAMQLLQSNTVCISDTFLSEIDTYCARLKAVGGVSHFNTLMKNLDFFFVLVEADKVRYDGHNRDIWEMILDSRRMYGNICVITDDRLLISRIVNAGLNNVDVCSNIEESTFSAMWSRTNFAIQEDTGGEELAEFTKNMNLVGENRRSVRLGSPIGEGGKSGYVMQEAGRADTVIKLYYEEPCYAKVNHIRTLTRLKDEPVSWCLFPKELIYYQNTVVGFSMPRCNSSLLISNKLYEGIGNDCKKKDVYLNRKLSYTIRLCLMLLTQIKFLNARYGIVIFDFNTKNFSNYTPGYPLTFFDTDSFMNSSLFFDGSLADDCFSRDYKGDYESLIQLSYESAVKLIFELISLGYPPIVGCGEGFCFSNESPRSLFSYKKLYFPKKIYRVMEDLFTGKCRPSIDTVIHALTEVKKYLDEHPDEDLTYRQITAYAAEAKKRVVSPSEITDIPKGKNPSEAANTPAFTPTPSTVSYSSSAAQRASSRPQSSSAAQRPSSYSYASSTAQKPKEPSSAPFSAQKTTATSRAEKATAAKSKSEKKTIDFGSVILKAICLYLIICAIYVGFQTDWSKFDLIVYIGEVFRFAYQLIVNLFTSVVDGIKNLFQTK